MARRFTDPARTAHHTAVPMDDIDVWRLDCTRHRDAGCAFDSALAPRERMRLREMRNPEARLHFAAGRWLARRVLARRLGRRETQIELTVDAHGRPSLDGGGIDFNLSHAGSCVVVALSSARVGIDVESTRRTRHWQPIARRFFSPAETAAIDASAMEERRMAFFRIWVRKEAFVKALGTGVATGFARFDVSAGPEAALLAARIEGVETSEWSILDFETDTDHVGAVAVRASRPRLRVHDIEPWSHDAGAAGERPDPSPAARSPASPLPAETR